MSIEFKTPEPVEKQLQMVQMVAENVMRPESRPMDDAEHARPTKFINMMWPNMKELERSNLEASLARSRRKAEAKPTGPTAKQRPMGPTATGPRSRTRPT